MQRFNSFNNSIFAAPAFPPPLWGRDREGGSQGFPQLATTPTPNPSPQGGGEQTVLAAPFPFLSQT
jgi:ATP-dependent helicase HrpB